MGILLPPKIYLDTNHLIEIARARKSVSANAYSFIDRQLTEGRLGVIVSPAAALDWVDGKATMESAKEIAEVVDSARLQYEIEADSFVFLHEIQTELRRIESGIRLPDFDVLFLRDSSGAVPRALSVLKKTVPDFFGPEELLAPNTAFPNESPFCTAVEYVERAYLCKTERSSVYRERVDGHKAAYSRDRDTFARRHDKRLVSAEHISWMKRFVRVDRVIAALNPDISVDSLLARVDLTNCPAVNLFLSAHAERVMAKQEVRDNDVDDWMIVHIVPFAELVLTERNLSHFIRQANPSLGSRVTHDPKMAIEILRPWIGESDWL